MPTKTGRTTGLLLVSISLASLAGCYQTSGTDTSGDRIKSTKTTPAEVEFPEGDPSVSAELGGPGFQGEGWQTASPGPLGDTRAVKGGAMLTSMPSWPENLRQYGTGANTWLNSIIESMCYESLCRIHPQTLEPIPSLASHWKIADDFLKFQFRINPRAHWSDGKPVVAQDWIATYRLINDDTLIDPMTKQAICDMMEEPKALSKYMLEVNVKPEKKSWRNFLTIMGMVPLPAHQIEGLGGEEYRKKYNFAFPASSGAYVVNPSDIRKNESLTLTRRKDYWAADEEANQGLYNFDKIRFLVVRDQRLSFDKACKGELDFYPVYTASWWAEDITPLEPYQKGQLIRQSIYTRNPKGTQGQAFNMRKPPLDDVRVRKALCHLYDRKTMLKKFAYDAYDPLKSYYPSSDAENPDNPMIEFDPQQALELLAEAGWNERGADGILVKDGERLSLTILYRTQGFEKYLTNYQEDCRKVGVELNLELVTPETHWQSMMERSYHMAGMAWSAILFPYPRSNWHSEMADKEGSNNITGFKSEVADKLIDQYDAEFDLDKRNELLRKLDAEIYNQHPYALEWYNASERLLYWNKFGMPDYVLNRYEDWRAVFSSWWYDAEKAALLKETLKNGQKMGPIPPPDLRPWEEAQVAQQGG